MTPSAIIHASSGTKGVPGCEPHDGRCWLCAGTMTRGQLVEKWKGANFTGSNRVRCPDATHVCEPCVFVTAGRPPDTLRMYSHIWEDGRGYSRHTKGDKPTLRAFLLGQHSGEWFAAIADSGQKHLISWAPINAPGRGGLVNFEETIVRVPSDGAALVGVMAELLTLGATKEELLRGEYGPRAWQLCGDALRDFEQHNGRLRHGSWFGLALWLAQRDEERVQARMQAEKEAKKNVKRGAAGKAADPNRRGAARAAKRVPGDTKQQLAEALRDSTEPDASGSANNGDASGVVDGHVSRSPAEQLTLGELFSRR